MWMLSAAVAESEVRERLVEVEGQGLEEEQPTQV